MSERRESTNSEVVWFIVLVFFLVMVGLSIIFLMFGCGSERTATTSSFVGVPHLQAWVPPMYDEGGRIIGPRPWPDSTTAPVLWLWEGGQTNFIASEYRITCPNKPPPSFPSTPVHTYQGVVNFRGEWFPENSPGLTAPIVGTPTQPVSYEHGTVTVWLRGHYTEIDGFPAIRCTTFAVTAPPCNPSLLDTFMTLHTLVHE